VGESGSLPSSFAPSWRSAAGAAGAAESNPKPIFEKKRHMAKAKLNEWKRNEETRSRIVFHRNAWVVPIFVTPTGAKYL
jgi:hypothetical protein